MDLANHPDNPQGLAGGPLNDRQFLQLLDITLAAEAETSGRRVNRARSLIAQRLRDPDAAPTMPDGSALDASEVLRAEGPADAREAPTGDLGALLVEAAAATKHLTIGQVQLHTIDPSLPARLMHAAGVK
jgi:hypothetical protein